MNYIPPPDARKGGSLIFGMEGGRNRRTATPLKARKGGRLVFNVVGSRTYDDGFPAG
jgi:hypothetical protein